MTAMSVSITLDATSMLFITFSSQAWVESGDTMYWRALVDGTQAYPVSSYIIITQQTDYGGSNSFTFYRSAAAGTHTVKIQWATYTGSGGHVGERTLTVIALPT